MFRKEQNRIYLENEQGRLVAEITFPETAPGVYTIDRTFVDDSLRGRGVASELVRLAVDAIRRGGGEARATCSYAARWLAERDAPDVLLVNACVRPESRTLRLARRLLDRLGGRVTEVDLQREALRALDAEALNRRDALLARGETDDPTLRYARQFAAAKQIVVAAPYWDLSFPAALKTYFEHVTVNGVTFSYGPDGRPVGHCRAERLFYVMTAGGPILPPNHGYGYAKSLAETFYGVPEIQCFSAELLDVEGVDAEAVLREAERRIDGFFRNNAEEERTGK